MKIFGKSPGGQVVHTTELNSNTWHFVVVLPHVSDSAKISYNFVVQFSVVQRSQRFLHCQIQPVYFVNNQLCLKFSEQHMLLCHCQSAVVDVNHWRCVAGTFFFSSLRLTTRKMCLLLFNGDPRKII